MSALIVIAAALGIQQQGRQLGVLQALERRIVCNSLTLRTTASRTSCCSKGTTLQPGILITARSALSGPRDLPVLRMAGTTCIKCRPA